MSLDSKGKLDALRELMKERELDVYVVPSEDAHASEYLAPCDSRRAYLTSFTGSAGCAVVTKTEARCWTDGRYWLQAEKQLGEGWTLMKQGLPEVPTWGKWLKEELPPSSRIGIDPTILPFSESSTLTTSLTAEPTTSTLVPVAQNLVDMIWSSRPQRPLDPIFRLEDRYAGEAVKQKLGGLRDKLRKTGSPALVVSQLDEIAWMFNLRGSDIPYNPVFWGYAILTSEDCTLFVHATSLSEPVRDYLHINGITILQYDQVWTSLETLSQVVKEDESKEKDKDNKDKGEKIVKTDKVLIGNKTSWAVAKAMGEDLVEVRRSMVEEAKAIKNATEVEGFRQCHIRDGAALVRYFAWLEEVLAKGEKWTEYDAAMMLESFRRQNKWFMGLSFDTISSTGPNAAVIHYSPPKFDSTVIDPNAMYLCDSGAQYLDGTTDTTRTLHFGEPSAEEKRAFTRVLQGHIALDTVIVPQGTTGYLMWVWLTQTTSSFTHGLSDAIARRPLWSDGLDYRHGTGHGVGSFLNVHEGPQGIGPRPAYNEVPLQAGMVISNEPGYYADGKWGIRIENIIVVKIAETPNNFGGKGYLEFEHVTMCPMQTKLVQVDLLSPAEKQWLNEYHREVREKVAPLLEQMEDQRALAWLEKETAEI
ncbi:hypothetical protein EHS25_001230 [Saitozyma podzolica]|uniref:Xaa-Pro aminopeptidase P n=1 Tax=Saitozyma podzolica TaxID=1890683 RepID=A0A427YHK5_9TREE|nr:hypothetical protein EHS25_001230 [Saitozyma podzolica]